MFRNLDRIIDAAGLREAQMLTVVQSSSFEAPVTRGALLILIDDDDARPWALRRYPPSHRLQIVTEDGQAVRATVAEALILDLPVGGALALDPIELCDIRYASDGVRGVIDRLRDPLDGCPWDNAQTHESLRPHLLEETYEVLEAIAGGDTTELCEELGDLLMQVVLHAKLAEQAGAFTLDDVSEGIRAKLVRRHPHVFAEAEAETPQLVEGAWERLKATERPAGASVLDGVPRTLPALARAQSILGRAARNGYERESVASGAIGEQLLNLIQEARARDVSAEDALRDALAEFERDVRGREASRASDSPSTPAGA